jgi:hypothetical protein
MADPSFSHAFVTGRIWVLGLNLLNFILEPSTVEIHKSSFVLDYLTFNLNLMC